MADIFISYAHPDRDKVARLAAYLESEGWTVWWDTDLKGGAPYRDEIMQQLAAARAVIVLWSRNSINSDFVRAEAGRAKAFGKFIPIRDDDVRSSDIPLPFGEVHTEKASNLQLVRAAVVAQLAKPEVEQGTLTSAAAMLRYSALTWMGIVGGAVTIFTNIRELLNLSHWAALLVDHWHAYSIAFWKLALSWAGLTVPRDVATFLSLTSFSVMMAVGARGLAARGPRDRLAEMLAAAGPTWHFVGLWLMWGMLDGILGSRNFVSAVSFWLPLAFVAGAAAILWEVARKGTRTQISIAMFCGMYWVLTYLMFLSKRFDDSGVVFVNQPGPSGLWSRFFWDLREFGVGPFLLAALPFAVPLLPLVMLAICPPAAIVKRMVFMTVGLATLVGLNLLSVHVPQIENLLRAIGKSS